MREKARVMEWAEIQPGTTVYVEGRPTGWASDDLIMPERYEILSRTDDDRLEIVWHLDPAPEAYHGYLTNNPGIRVWDRRPLPDERREVPWDA